MCLKLLLTSPKNMTREAVEHTLFHTPTLNPFRGMISLTDIPFQRQLNSLLMKREICY